MGVMKKIITDRNSIFIAFLIFIPFLLMLSACTSTYVAAPRGSVEAMPEWVRDPYTRFDRQSYIAIRGSGNTLAFAERSALGNLAAFFEQHIEINETAIERYQEIARDGRSAAWSVSTELETEILRHARFDSLIGAEIADVWNDGWSYYAVAILNKPRAIQIYSNIVDANQRMIDNLLDMPVTERYTLEAFSRYQFAADIADMTAPYLNLLSVIGGFVPPFRSGDEYRLQALNITRAIPINLRVQNDTAGRLQGAFARVVSDLGFQSGGTNSRYLLDVYINTTPVVIAGSPHSWARIEVSANLIDTAFGTVLLPYNFNIREGHTTQAEANNRAVMAAERRIIEEYTHLLSEYLSRLLPQR